MTTLKPIKDKLLLDVMVGDRYYTTLSLKVSAGTEYTFEELRTYALMKLPSLANKDFSVIPTANKTFRN